MFAPVRTVAPAITPVSLAEAKVHCNANEFTDDDAMLMSLIEAATAHLDGWTGILGRCLCEQTWRQDFDSFRSYLRLPLFPVISIVSIDYTDVADAKQTIATPNYILQCDELGARVEFVGGYSFPPRNSNGSPICISYVAGYVDAPAVEADGDIPAVPRGSTVPSALKHAILMLVSHWYQNRDAILISGQVAELPFAVNALIAPFRRVGV